MEPIAVIGFSFKLPQDADDSSSFWEMLEAGRNVMTEWPSSRVNIDAFHNSDASQKNTVGVVSSYEDRWIEPTLIRYRSKLVGRISSIESRGCSMHLSSPSPRMKLLLWILNNA